MVSLACVDFILSKINKLKKYFVWLISNTNHWNNQWFSKDILNIPCITKDFSRSVDLARNTMVWHCVLCSTGHKLNFSCIFVVEKYNYANMYSDTVAYDLVS